MPGAVERGLSTVTNGLGLLAAAWGLKRALFQVPGVVGSYRS